MKNKTTITVETWERTTIRRGAPQTIIARCESCGVETKMISPDETARFFGVALRRIYRRIENGDFHFVETETGALLICGGSLLQEETKIRRFENGV